MYQVLVYQNEIAPPGSARLGSQVCCNLSEVEKDVLPVQELLYCGAFHQVAQPRDHKGRRNSIAGSRNAKRTILVCHGFGQSPAKAPRWRIVQRARIERTG